MSRNLFVPFLAAAFVLAPGILPTVFAPSTTMSLSGSALAQKSTPTTDSKNLNSSRSNITQTDQTQQPGAGGDNARMGGGGGARGGGARMGGGGGTSTNNK
jgi:uncharacterized membrane protein YgcG